MITASRNLLVVFSAFVVAFLAAVIPAARAARVDPIIAMRSE